VFPAATTTFELVDGQTLGVVNYTQANGLNVDGTGDTTIVYKFSPLGAVLTATQIDASDYNVTTLRALANSFTTGGANNNVEFAIDDLPSSVELRLYADPSLLGFLDPTFRVVTIEAGVSTPGTLIFNDYDGAVVGDEVRTLTLNLEGDAQVSGDISIPTRTGKLGGTYQYFDTLTIKSEGTQANAITGNINTAVVENDGTNTSENNLLNVVINADQDLVIGTFGPTGLWTSGGDIIFNNRDTVVTNDVAANLTVTGAADVTMHGLDVTDNAGGNISVLNIVNNAATLTLTGGTAAIEGNHLEVLNLSGSGDIVMGSNNNGTGAEGIDSTSLSLINASGLTGDLTLAEILVDNANFALISGTGVTTLTVTGDTLAADFNGPDNIDGNADDDLGWSFDLSDAAAGSQLRLGANTYTSGDLAIDLGANATLYIDANTNWTALNSLSITGVQAIVLADDVTLTLTAAQASGLNIIAGPVLTAPYNGQVNIVNLGEYTDLNANGLNDDVAELFDYDFSGITVAATATLYDNDVTISAGSDLGTVAISLSDVADNFSTADVNELAGQTIRFNTEAQAARTINVPADVGGNTPSTNVVWLFESITGTINTNNYSPNLQRLWINEALIISEGGDAENLFTTLPNSILRVEFTDPAELPVLDSSTDINRVVELVAFTDVSASGLIFADQDRLEHVQNLNLLLGGEVLLGDLEIGNIVNPVIDPVTGHGVATPTFQTLTITSNRAVRTNDLLAPVDYVNDNDGVNETKANSDLDFGTAGDQTNANLVGNENVLPVNLNTIGDISIGTAGQYGLDLMNVVIATGAVTTTGDGSAGQGARLQIGTITFDNDAAAAGANLSVSGNNSVTIKSLDTSDADITALTVTSTMSGPDGILNVTGGSPGFDGGNATGNTETLTITNGTGTINFGSAKAAPATGFWAGVYGEELSTLTVNNGGGTVNLGRIGEVDNEAFTLNVTGTGPVTFTLGIADANGLKAPNLSATGTWSFTGIGATTTMTIENDPTSVLDDAMFVPGGVLNLTNLNVIIAGNVDLSVLGTGLNADTTNVTFMVPLGSVLTLTAEQADGVDVDGLGTVNIVGDYGQSTVGGAHDYDLSELANTTNINLSGITGLVDTDGTGPLVAPTAVTLNLTTETGAASFPHNVTGSNFADVITTGSGADTINSGAGNDVITAGAGADLIDGGAGNDTINGFTAGDTVNGGADLDTLQLVDPDGAGPLLAPTDFNAATDAQLVNVEIIEGTTGDDLINTTNQTENLTINGGNGADTIIAGGGNDSINGGAGADSIVAGAGNDTIVGAQDDVLLDGGIGADVLEIGADFNDTSDAQIVNIETVNLTAAGLTVTLDAQGSTVAGNNEGLVINAYANAALVTGVATNGTAGSPESSTYTLNALTAGQSITIAGFTVTATADATAAQVADAFRGATVTGLARTGAFTAAGWAGATLGGSGATLTFTNTVNGDVANLTASSTLGSIITGGADNDTINGGNGADSLTGGTGADSILAGAGNDTIVGAQDDVLLDGGTGTDTLRVATAFDDVSDAQIVNIENVDLTTGGVFSFDAQSEGLNIVATAASTITGGSGADTITGSAAADSIVGGAGADSIVAGGGADTIVGAQDDVLLDGGADADVLQIGANFNDASDAQIANIETVTLTAAGLNVSLDAQTEGMVINAFANYAPVVGVATNGTAGTPESSAFTLNPITAGQSVTINGLTVTATAAATAIQLADAFRGIAVPGLTRTGSSGTPTGWTGAALVGGTVGTDVLTFTNTVVGDVDNFTTSLSGPGATITGGTGADTINGSNGNDSLIGADGADSIVAGNGNDTIVGAQNDALLDGGAGADLLQIGANFDDANDAQIANIETVTLTATGLTVSLDAQTEGLVINGFAAGSSTIIGGSGADSITGGSGADLLTGGAGVDSIDGGAGNDTIVISAANDSGAETLTGGLGTDTLQVVDDMTINAAAVVSGFEAISLAEDADLTIAAAELADNPIATVTGTAGGATETVIFTGTADPDSINLSGITTVTDATLIVNAGADDDDIVGSAFGDILNGEAGQDTITGGQGNDTMTGGAAADTFVFIADGVAETDTITDWGVGGNNDAVAGALGAGDQLNVTFSPWDGSGASVNPTNTDATAGGNGVVNFVTSYKVGDVITITFNGTDSVSRTVQAGATSGTDVALAFQAVFASLTMGTSFDADLVDGVGSATVTAALDGSAVLYIVNDSGGDGAFTIDSTVAVANGYVFDASVIAATNGVVSVTGNDGADTITGGVGNDTIIGGTGADSMFGGDGNDTFIFATAAQLAAAQVNGGTGTDTIQVTGTTLVNSDFVNKSGFERLEFTGVSAHSVTLGALTNAAFASGITITSNTAAAGLTVIGTASTVEINATGTNNADTLTGGSVADILNGGAGDDSITGGEGADVINGGAGADVINLTETTSAQDTVFLADVATTDTITGFNVTAGDATEDLLVFDFSEIEGSGDYVNLDDAASAASTDAPLFQTITGAFDLGTATADSNILIANLAGNIANAGALETALEAGGGLALTVNQAWAVGDTFLAAYDDGAHTYIARVVVGGNGAADDETFAAGELNATVLVQLTGVTDVTALAASNFDFVV
jgi:Ca2+-binding RTX toxin-like protein